MKVIVNKEVEGSLRGRREVLILALLTVLFYGCSGQLPANLGVADGKLSPCPDSPNCVSSFADDEDHKIDPFKFSIPAEALMQKLKSVVSGREGARIMEPKELYLRAEFTSSFFKFVDDVEFLIDPNTNTLHCRSASRVGYSDMGANRDRIVAILKELESAIPPPAEEPS